MVLTWCCTWMASACWSSAGNWFLCIKHLSLSNKRWNTQISSSNVISNIQFSLIDFLTGEICLNYECPSLCQHSISSHFTVRLAALRLYSDTAELNANTSMLTYSTHNNNANMLMFSIFTFYFRKLALYIYRGSGTSSMLHCHVSTEAQNTQTKHWL